jgi:hypothetical protein
MINCLKRNIDDCLNIQSFEENDLISSKHLSFISLHKHHKWHVGTIFYIATLRIPLVVHTTAFILSLVISYHDFFVLFSPSS